MLREITRPSGILITLLILHAFYLVFVGCVPPSPGDPVATARAMFQQGSTAVQIAEALRSKHALTAEEVAPILADLGCSAVEIGETFRDVFSLDPNTSDVFTIEAILDAVGFQPEAYLDFTAVASIKRFAPILGFDGAAKDFPMSADDYFTGMMLVEVDKVLREVTWLPRTDGPTKLCGRDECKQGMENSDPNLLLAGAVPTYFKVISDVATGRLRIQYWWFYGFQGPCNLFKYSPGWPPPDDGAHHGDWEKIIVTTSPDRSGVDAVTFYQHSGWYTRLPGSYESSGDRPLVFVGKIAHGSYHYSHVCGKTCTDTLTSWMSCLYWNDERDPDDLFWNTSNNLVSLRGNSESWMEPDHIGSMIRIGNEDYTITDWRWGPSYRYCENWFIVCLDWYTKSAISGHPTIRDLNWTMAYCESDGCDKSQKWPASLNVPESIASAAKETASPPAVFGAPVTAVDRQTIIEALSDVLAATLGMSVEEVKAAGASGLTICELAEVRGLDLAEVWPATADLREVVLQQDVEEGQLSQAQADWLKERLVDQDSILWCLEQTSSAP